MNSSDSYTDNNVVGSARKVPARADSNCPLQDVGNVKWTKAGLRTFESEANATHGSDGKGVLLIDEATSAAGTVFMINTRDDVVRTPRMPGRIRQLLQGQELEEDAKTDSPALVLGLSCLELGHDRKFTPASPLFSFQTSSAARSSVSFTTPSTAGVRLALSTPPRTPEERVLAVLADDADADEWGTEADGCQDPRGGLDPSIRGWGLCAGGTDANDDDSSSGDELDCNELERMGISPLSLQSLCRTPVDDVIAEMLLGVDAGNRHEDADATSPVPFRIMDSPLAGTAKAQP